MLKTFAPLVLCSLLMHTSIHLSPRWCLPVGQYRFLYTFRISDAEDTFRTVGALFFVDATSIHLSPRWCLPVGQYRFLYTFRISDGRYLSHRWCFVLC